MSHLMGVASLAMEASVYCDAGSTTDIGIGALLHDAIEDQGHQITLEDIENKFGAVPAQIVRECTDSDIVPKPPWKARKQVYIDSVVTKAKASQLVSAADKLHNALAILFDHSRLGVAVFDRFSVEAAEVVWYYVLKRAWTSKLGWVSPKRHGSVIGMGVCLTVLMLIKLLRFFILAYRKVSGLNVCPAKILVSIFPVILTFAFTVAFSQAIVCHLQPPGICWSNSNVSRYISAWRLTQCLDDYQVLQLPY